MKYFLILTVSVGFAFGCSQKEKIAVAPNDPQIAYTGRINFANPSQPVLYWPGSEVTLKINGTGVKTELDDSAGDNFFNVVIDGVWTKYLQLESGKQWYTLAEDLPEGEHTVSLIKRNEWDKGSTTVTGFEVEGTLLPQAPRKPRTIEFIGNSITAGYAIEDLTGGDSPDSIYTNNYLTYGAITARHFDANYLCTCRSGIGITVSWDPSIIMPEVFPRLNPNDSSSRWDFSQLKPDLVVVNLLQNDSWLVNLPDQPAYKARFGETPPTTDKLIASYQEFISLVRTVYPGTPIVCALGSMDATKAGSPWPGYVQQAVDGLGDSLVYTHFFPYIEKDGHPRLDDNKKMAESLIGLIETKLNW